VTGLKQPQVQGRHAAHDHHRPTSLVVGTTLVVVVVVVDGDDDVLARGVLDRQVDALRQAGIDPERTYLDRKSGATTERPGLKAAMEYARDGDVIVVHTLDRLGRTVRDILKLIHELAERGVGVRNLADPIRVDSASPDDPIAQLSAVLLALFGQMERTYTLERAAHARAVATAKGRRIGRPTVVDPDKLAYARCTCARPGTPSRRSSPRPASPAPACTGTCRPDRRGCSPGRQARRMYDARELTVEQIGEVLGVSRTSIYRALQRDDAIDKVPSPSSATATTQTVPPAPAAARRRGARA